MNEYRANFIIGLYYGSMSFREVNIDTYLNTPVSGQHRATVLSIASMIVSSLAIFMLPAPYLDLPSYT